MENKSKSQPKKAAIKRKVHPNDADKLGKKNDSSKLKSNDLDHVTNKKIGVRVFYNSTIRKQSSQSSVTKAIIKAAPNLPDLKPVNVAPVKTTNPKMPDLKPISLAPVITAKPKLPDLKPDCVTPVQITTKPSEPLFSYEFVPITSESIQHVLAGIEQIAWQSRLVLVVFDELFMKTDLTFNLIKCIYEPIVGHLDSDCVFLKTNLGQLMPNLAEAYAREFEAKNQAYIVCSKELSEEEVVRRACEKRILFGVMTSSCVVNSLKKETFLIKKEVLLDRGAIKPDTLQEIRQLSFDKAQDNTKSKSDRVKPAQSNEKNKTATKKDKDLNKISSNIKNVNRSQAAFEAKLLEKVENDTKESDNISKILPELTAFGDVVIRVNMLPGELSMNTLSIILGCHTIKRDQVIAAKWRQKGSDFIDVHIVTRSHNSEVEKILKLHNQETPNRMRLQVMKTNLKDFEKYLRNNHSRIFRLEGERTQPLKVIGYSNKNQ